MSKSLWVFLGSVPEEGDLCLVWASDASEAMLEGRRLMHYSPEDDPDVEDEDFEVHLATAVEIIEWCPSLLYRTTPLETDGSVLDTERVRAFLTSELRAIQALHGCAEANGTTA